MLTVAAIVAGLLTIAGAIMLMVPALVEISATTRTLDERARWRVQIRWLGVTRPARFGSNRRRASKPHRDTSGDTRFGLASARALLQSPGFGRRVVRLLRELAALTCPQRVRLHGRIGFDDPSTTGMLLGWLYGASGRPANPSGWSIRVEPDFSGETLEGEFDARWSRSLGALLWPVVTFAASPAVWRALAHAWRARKRPRSDS